MYLWAFTVKRSPVGATCHQFNLASSDPTGQNEKLQVSKFDSCRDTPLFNEEIFMSNTQEISQEIMKIIQIAAVNGTLTTESVDYVKGVLNQNQKLSDELIDAKDILRKSEKKEKKLKEELMIYSERRSDLISREKSVSEREEKMTALECEVKFQKERVNDHREMFALVFRNIETRRNVFTPITGGTQYDGKQSSGFVQKDEEINKSI